MGLPLVLIHLRSNSSMSMYAVSVFLLKASGFKHKAEYMRLPLALIKAIKEPPLLVDVTCFLAHPIFLTAVMRALPAE